MATPSTPIIAPIITPAAPVPHESLLHHIGAGFKKVFDFVLHVAVVAQPLVAAFAPEIAGLYSFTVTEALKAEAIAAAAGQQEGTGVQKAAMVLQAIEPELDAYFKKAGVPYNSAVAQKYLDAVVATLNLLPPIPAAS